MAAKRPSHSLSTLAETAEEYIKLECVRRRNQINIRRRSSLHEQYSMGMPTSRIKERQAQSRHHEFLLRKENKAAIDMILDRVRDVAEVYSSARESSTPLSPMEKSKLLAWADDVDKVLADFTPSENHSLDPIVRMLDKLQFLHDGHVCLAEVGVDARALLERWERDGVFDSSDSSDDDDNGGGGGDGGTKRTVNTINEDEDEGVSDDTDNNVTHSRRRHRDKIHLTNSHPYETVRQRAAANMIKRCILRWARSLESFRDRVEEIQIFGKTTSSLMKELTSTTSKRGASAAPSSDIFDLVKVRRDGMFAHSIGFTELMHFSKHVALFSVDQAIRTVEDLGMKRFLFLTRCALKLQTIWRKARKEFQARRMRRLVEELRLQHERQEQEERKQRRLLLLASKGNTLGTSEGKRRSVFSSSKKSRAMTISTPPSTSGSHAMSRGGEQTESQPSTLQSARLRGSVSGTPKRKEASSRSRGSVTEAMLGRKRPLNRVKSINASSRFNDDDGDTRDVESAWQSFLDSAAEANALIPVTKAADAVAEGTLVDVNDATETQRVVMPELMDDDWRNWSDGDESGALLDDEADLEAEEKIARQLRLAVRTALPSTPDTEFAQIANQDGGALGARGYQELVNHSTDRAHDDQLVASRHGSRRTTRFADKPSELTAPPFTVGFDDDVDRFRTKKTRVGTVNRMVPFADFEATRESESEIALAAARRKSRKASRKHLHEVDFGRGSPHLALLELLDPLAAAETDSSDDESASEAREAEPPQAKPLALRVHRSGSTRKRRVEIIKHSIEARETENITYPTRTREAQRAANDVRKQAAAAQREQGAQRKPDESSERFTYSIQKLDIRREVVMRRASHPTTPAAASSTLSQPAVVVNGGEPSSNRDPAKKFGTQAEWLRSTGLDQAPLRLPRPPPPRLHIPQRPGGGSGKAAASNAVASPSEKRRVVAKRRLKRFLPVLDRPVAATVDDDRIDTEVQNAASTSKTTESTAKLPTIERSSRRGHTGKAQTQVRVTGTHSSSASLVQSEETMGVRNSGVTTALEDTDSTESEATGHGSKALESDSAWSESESTSDAGGEASGSSDIELQAVGSLMHSADGTGVDDHSKWHVSDTDAGAPDDSMVATLTEEVRGTDAHESHVRIDTNVNESTRPRHSTHPRTASRITAKKSYRKLCFAALKQTNGDGEALPYAGSDSDEVDASAPVRSTTTAHLAQKRSHPHVTKVRARSTHHSVICTLDSSDGGIRGADDKVAAEECREPEMVLSRRHEEKRQAEFQRLMMQYLGLLQCEPSATRGQTPEFGGA